MRHMNVVLLGCVFAASTAWQPARAVAEDNKASPPRLIGNPGDWFPQSSMPAESVVRGQVGAVIIQLSLNADGAVMACRVLESSGYQLLDAAACERAKNYGRFEPARDGKGNGIASTFILPRIRYILSNGNRSAATVDAKRNVYNSTIQIQVGTSGNIESCRTLNTDTTDKSACGGYVVDTPTPSAFKVSGGAEVTISNTIVVDRKSER